MAATPKARSRAGRRAGYVAACILIALCAACNRDFSTPYDGGDGTDTATVGGTPTGDPPVKEKAPDSVKVGDMQFTVGDGAAAPKVTWYPSDFADKRFSLVSDNASIAKVEGGKVKPVAAGEAEVTLITEAGRVVRTFLVTVKSKPKPPDPVVIRVISVTANPMNLLVGQEAVPQLSWNPANAADKEFSLDSQDPDIASIRGSRVVAKAAGSATVVVTTKDGGKTAAFTVTVTEPDRRVRLQSLAATDLTLAPGEEKDPILAWTPQDVTDKGFKLLSSEPGIVSIQGLRVRAETPGTSVIMVQPTDDPAKAVAFKIKVSVPLAGISAPDMSFTLGDAPRAPQVTFQPANATDRRWKLASLDAAVAAVVNDSLVQPQAVGEARMVLTAVEGGHRFEFGVKVSAKVIPVLSITVQDLSLRRGDPDADPIIAWTPADATDKGFQLSAAGSADAAASAVGNKVHPLKAGTQTFVVTPTGGGQPASFQVTVLPWLDSLSAAPMLIADDAAGLTPSLTWYPADAPDKTYSLATSDPAKVSVAGASFSAAGLGAATLTVTATEGSRQCTFPVTVMKKRCVEVMEGRGNPHNAEADKQCCQETYQPCPEPPPPIDPPVDPIDPPPADTLSGGGNGSGSGNGKGKDKDKDEGGAAEGSQGSALKEGWLAYWNG